MGDTNPIRTLEDYSKPSHEGYRNTIELPEGNNMQRNKPQNDKSEGEDREDRSNPENIDTTPPSPHDPSNLFITKKVCKLDSFLESSDLVPQSPDTKIVCTKGDDGDVMFIEIIRKNDDSREEGPADEGSAKIEGLEVEYFDTFPTTSELAYQRYLMSGSIPSLFLRNPIITEGCPSNLKIMRRKLDLGEDTNRGVSNFTGRIKGMHVFVGNFTYVIDFMIVEDISSIIDPRLSQVVLGKPFVEISNMTHDPPEGVARFTNGTDEIAYKMPHKIEQYNSLSDLEKDHTKSIYLRNEEDKRRGVEKFLIKNEEETFTVHRDSVEIKPDGVASQQCEDSKIFKVNPKVSLYISYAADFTLGVVVFVFDLQVIFDEKKLRSS
ncbi:hypothetical protein Tco_0355015 [Tanacetum coccineum]